MATRARRIEQTPDVSASPNRRARAARIPEAAADALTADPAPLAPETVIGERRYSFNALLTIGVAGFLLGRLCAR